MLCAQRSPPATAMRAPGHGLFVACLFILSLSSPLVDGRTAADARELDRLHGLTTQGKVSEAAAGLKSFLAAHDDDGVAWLYLGHALIMPGTSYDIGASSAAYRKAVDRLHEDETVEHRSQALLWLGVSLRRAQKDIPASLIYITRALELTPRDAEAHTHAATSYSMTSDLTNAVKHLMASTLISSPDRLARDYSRIADILMRVQDWETAAEMLNKCFQVLLFYCRACVAYVW